MRPKGVVRPHILENSMTSPYANEELGNLVVTATGRTRWEKNFGATNENCDWRRREEGEVKKN